MNSPVNLIKWVAEERGFLVEFQAFWAAKNKEDPTNFPLDLRPAEWDEQFSFWRESARR